MSYGGIHVFLALQRCIAVPTFVWAAGRSSSVGRSIMQGNGDRGGGVKLLYY